MVAVSHNTDTIFSQQKLENEDTTYIAYVSEQNLVPDAVSGPVAHPDTGRMFEGLRDGRYVLRADQAN